MSRRRQDRGSPYDFIFSGDSSGPFSNIERGLNVERTYSTDIQIRRDGERSFGNGEINIKGNMISLRYKRFLGREKKIHFTRDEIENIEFKNRGLSMEFVPQNLPEDQTWLTMDIKLKENGSYSFFVGQQLGFRSVKKFNDLCDVLNSRSSKLRGPGIKYIYENMKKEDE